MFLCFLLGTVPRRLCGIRSVHHSNSIRGFLWSRRTRYALGLICSDACRALRLAVAFTRYRRSLPFQRDALLRGFQQKAASCWTAVRNAQHTKRRAQRHNVGCSRCAVCQDSSQSILKLGHFATSFIGCKQYAHRLVGDGHAKQLLVRHTLSLPARHF